MGEYEIDLHRYGWFPSHLPSRAAESSDESDGDEPEERAAQ